MKRIWVALMVLVLCGIFFGQNITMKNGETSPTIPITMFVKATGLPSTGLTITDLYVVYQEYRSSAVALGADIPTALGALNTPYMNSDGTPAGNCMMIETYGGGYRLDLPPEAVDGGIHTQVQVWCWNAATYADATSVGYAIIQLTPAVDAVLADGTTPPTQSGIVDDVWNELVADHTTTGSYGLQVGAGSAGPVPPSLSQASIWAGTISSATTNTVVLGDNPLPASTDSAYVGYMLVWSYDNSENVAKSEYHRITGYVASTKTVTISDTFVGSPAILDTVAIVPSGSLSTINMGDDLVSKITRFVSGAGAYWESEDVRTVHTNTSTTVQLAEDAGDSADAFNGYPIAIYTAAGGWEYSVITDYSGHSATPANDNVATVYPPLPYVPDGADTYYIYGGGVITLDLGAAAITDVTTGVTNALNSSTLYYGSALGSATEDNDGSPRTSTTTQVHLTGTISSLLFTPGTIVKWFGTGNVPVFGVVRSYDTTNKTIFLYSPATEAPSNASTIYAVGFMNTEYWGAVIGKYSGR